MCFIVGSFNSGLHKLAHLNLEGYGVTAVSLEVISGFVSSGPTVPSIVTSAKKNLIFDLFARGNSAHYH